jgi:hypothetical protein
MPFQTTGKRRISSTKSCVVFDKAKGTILHVHHVLTIEGGQETSDSEVEKKALELAISRGINASKVDVLSVDPKLFEQHARYKVDVKKQTLVALRRARKK